MKDFTTMETLLAKLAFKKLCTKAHCSVKHYKVDVTDPKYSSGYSTQ
jgi:hypothetical protein